MTAKPLTVQIVEMLEDAKGNYTTAQIAAALKIENKQASSTLSKLVKAGKVTRNEEGAYSAPWKEAEEAPEPVAEAPVTPEPEEAEEALPAAGSKEFNVDSWKRRIAAMLAKAERTENEHERDAYAKKAEAMMVRLGIHRAELEATGDAKKEKIVEAKREWTGNYSIVMLPFVHSVAQGFGGLITLESTYSAMLRTSYVVGPKSQVEEFCRLIDSLHIQVLSALKRYQKETRDERRNMTEMEKYLQHRSFITGFGQMVARRLLALRKGEEEKASTGAALVLASRATEAQEWVAAQYGPLKSNKGGMRYADASGLAAGREAGKTATLNQKDLAAQAANELLK